MLTTQRVLERARDGSAGSGSDCARAFVAAMGGLRVPPASQPTLEALQDNSQAADPRLVDCLLFLKNSEEVRRRKHHRLVRRDVALHAVFRPALLLMVSSVVRLPTILHLRSTASNRWLCHEEMSQWLRNPAFVY